VPPLVRVEGTATAVVEAVKLAADGSGDVVVRVYEALGRRGTVRLAPGFRTSGAVHCDLLEVPLGDQPVDPLVFETGPFVVATIRLRRASLESR
jgi:alpha-mannosidase